MWNTNVFEESDLTKESNEEREVTVTEKQLCSYLENLNQNIETIWLKKKRDSITEEQKLKLYKKEPITITTPIENGALFLTYKYYKTIIDWTKNTKKHWFGNAKDFAILNQIPCRFLVELGIFEKPKWITTNDIINDIKKDAKNYNTYLTICEKVLSLFPETKAIVPLISIAKHYTKRYKNEWTEMLIKIRNEKEEGKVIEHTHKELSTVTNKDNKST